MSQVCALTFRPLMPEADKSLEGRGVIRRNPSAVRSHSPRRPCPRRATIDMSGLCGIIDASAIVTVVRTRETMRDLYDWAVLCAATDMFPWWEPNKGSLPPTLP